MAAATEDYVSGQRHFAKQNERRRLSSVKEAEAHAGDLRAGLPEGTTAIAMKYARSTEEVAHAVLAHGLETAEMLARAMAQTNCSLRVVSDLYQRLAPKPDLDALLKELANQ